MDQEVPEGAPEEVTPESMMADLIQSDPYDKRLKPITEDSLITVAEKSK